MVVAVYNTVLLPDVEYRLGVHGLTPEEQFRLEVEKPDSVVILPLKAPIEKEELTAKDFFEYGVEAEVMEVQDSPQGTMLHARTKSKVKVSDIKLEDGLIGCTFETVNEIMDITEEGDRQLLEKLKDITKEVAKEIRGGEYALTYLKQIETVNEFGASFCQFFDMTLEEKYALLETDSFKERGLLIHEALLKFKGTIDMQVALSRQEDPNEVNHKKQAIKRQITQLEKVLSDMDPNAEEEENTFEKKIEAAGMPENVKKEVERTLRRFNQEPSNGAEYNSLYDYLDFVTSLKWNLKDAKEEKINLKKARKIMDRDHYGLDKVKDRILEHLAVMELNQRNESSRSKGTILLLVGAPGTGKTSMGHSIAEALGREYVRVALGGIRDESEIRGHRRTYVGAMPGRIMEGIKRAGSMNPVVVLDEVDKLQAGISGDPSAALLEVLDPEQNGTFTDHYMNLPYDLSHVVFICTANNWDTIPQPLLDRMEVVQLPGYTPVEHLQIAKKHLVKQAMEESGLKKKDLKITDSALKKIIADYTHEAGVRGLKKQILKICRKAAVEKLNGAEDTITIKEKNLENYLGRDKITHDTVLKKAVPGVVTGLAWTQAGGEILFIETVAMNGQGHVHLTGQIGDVMKESAETAMSLVKSYFMESDLDFSGRDIHLHIPEGAVPKDGPSAGITMFTALTSLVTGTPADRELAMTGEISLRGEVLPIGGLPEKLMAAVRAGVKKVLIPSGNVKDLEDVPKETKEKLTIIPVKTVEEVIKEALGIELPKRNTNPFQKKEETD